MSMNSPTVHLGDNVVAQVLDGQMVLLDTSGGHYFELNASGTVMLEQLLAGASHAEVAAAVERKFLVTSERVEADLEALLLTLREAGLIKG